MKTLKPSKQLTLDKLPMVTKESTNTVEKANEKPDRNYRNLHFHQNG